MTVLNGKLNENITPAEAESMLKVITRLSEGCLFTRKEYLQIAAICDSCVDRLMREVAE